MLHAQGVTKAYKSLTAVDRVDLDIEAGEIFALLGPNGAGKTTFIGCVAGLVAGFDGSISTKCGINKPRKISCRMGLPSILASCDFVSESKASNASLVGTRNV